jgi:hypothetical protein
MVSVTGNASAVAAEDTLGCCAGEFDSQREAIGSFQQSSKAPKAVASLA